MENPFKASASTMESNELPRISASPTDNSRKLEGELDRATYVYLDHTSNKKPDLDSILQSIIVKSGATGEKFESRQVSCDVYLVFFPSRFLRDRMVPTNGIYIMIKDCKCTFRRWRCDDGATNYRSVKKVWMKIHKLPLHHYSLDRAQNIVARIGNLRGMNMKNTDRNLATLDVLVECYGDVKYKSLIEYYYDDVFKKEISLNVMFEMGDDMFEKMDLSDKGLPYEEVELRAAASLKAGGYLRDEAIESGDENNDREAHRLPRLHASPNAASRHLESQLDRAAFVYLDDTTNPMVKIDKIIDYVANITTASRRGFYYRCLGYDEYLLFFPCRNVRETFVPQVEKGIMILDCWCTFKRWTSGDNAVEFKFEKKIWIKIYQLPLHHYSWDFAANLVFGIGVLRDMNMDQTAKDVKSLHALVDCADTKELTLKMDYHYDNNFTKWIVMRVVLEMSAGLFEKMGMFWNGHSYSELQERVKIGPNAMLYGRVKLLP